MPDELRVLIVEDSKADAELLVQQLRRAGYEPVWQRVDTAQALHAALTERAWDVILSDYSMPSFSAPAALELTQALGLDLPFIIVTGTIGEEAAVQILKAGANDYLLKDRLMRLGSTIERELRAAQARRERQQAEKALVRLRKAVDSSGEVIFMTDREGIITFVNPEFTRLYGYTAEEVVGKVTPRILKSETLYAEEAASFWQAILSRQVVKRELVNRTKDGKLVKVEVSVNPILGESGEIVGFLAIQRDVTEQKQLQEQFRQAQKMEAVGRLAGGVAHDFNNLLTVISGHTDLLLGSMPTDNPAYGQLQEIRRAAARAASLTRQLLAFSRRQVLVPQVLDLNTVVANMEPMVRRLIGEDIALATLLDPGLGRVKADPGQIEQVLLNLAVNSRDAMPQGGKLTIETRNADLDESYARRHLTVVPGHYVMLALSDTGCGMDAHTLSHIFEPFFTTKGPEQGTGLGLATVYGIVKQSGGYIWAYSEVGVGTTFRVYLPRVDAPLDVIRTEDVEVTAGGTETVLVVEDDPAVRALVQSVLGAKGYQVMTARSVEDALCVAEQHRGPIHLLLTDVVLPGAGGRELAEQLGPLHREMIVLYMSGYTDNAVVHHGVLDARVNFLQKPFTPQTLARKVRSVLDADRPS
jgi:two-component system cell cycle sensor histidine kinase/response regulator CckA